MPDIIQLLPDSVANQIAAGEVIQRPASVVKELVENAVDAGADEISVSIKDAGRTLIQVVDNGIGMSDTDARMAFERHATSKIRNAQDLFEIRTKGFRGEALASIAAIAQVILRTRQHEEEVGTEISINGSEVEYQQATGGPAGTSFIVKNLFYNVPARRKFLKSNTTELKHIINEFQHIVLAHPEIAFDLSHNDSDIFRLPKSNLRQRIVHVFGKSINTNLNTIQSVTSLVTIHGFIGKPELARKTSGEQAFYINQRYMRHPYFHRAVMKAYEKLLPADSFPSYFIFFVADPATIDVNIHPTKTEIKFENEQAIFQIIQAAVREALGKSNVVPSLDFGTEGVIDIPVLRKDTRISAPEIPVDYSYNPFETKTSETSTSGARQKQVLPDNWQLLYPEFEGQTIAQPPDEATLFREDDADGDIIKPDYLQLHNKYILTSVKSGVMLIDMRRAYERILYEQFIRSLAHNQGIAQRELYPTKIDLDPANYLLLQNIKEDLSLLGIDIGNLGQNTIVVNSCPAGIDALDMKELIESLLEEYKETEQSVGSSVRKVVAAALAKAASKGIDRELHSQELAQLVDELFACETPGYCPDGKKIISILKLDEIEKMLK
jgi:DNA mismatch repair protein MutL